MDHAGNLTAVFCLDGDTVTVASHGNNSVLQITAQRTIYQTGQSRVYPVINLIDGAADVLQRAAGIVVYLLLAQDTAADLCGDQSQRLQLFKINIQTVILVVSIFMTSIGLDAGSGLQKLADAKKLSGTQCTANLQAFQGILNGIASTEGNTTFLYNSGKCGSGLFLRGLDLSEVCRGF